MAFKSDKSIEELLNEARKNKRMGLIRRLRPVTGKSRQQGHITIHPANGISDGWLSDEQLASINPDEEVFNWDVASSAKRNIKLGDTPEYKRAIRTFPPASTKKKRSTGTRKAEGVLALFEGADNQKEGTSKARKKSSDEHREPDFLNKLRGSMNTSAPAVTESRKTREAPKVVQTLREGYEVISHIQDLAKRNGIANAFQLWQRVGGSKESAAQLWRGDFRMIGVSTLKKLCEVLNCGVGDLLAFEKPSTASRTT